MAEFSASGPSMAPGGNPASAIAAAVQAPPSVGNLGAKQAVVERLRQRIELCRRHHAVCEARYAQQQQQRVQTEGKERQALHRRYLESRAKKTHKLKQQQQHQQAEETGRKIEGADAPAGEQRSFTLIALQGQLKRKLEEGGGSGVLSGASERPNGLSGHSSPFNQAAKIPRGADADETIVHGNGHGPPPDIKPHLLLGEPGSESSSAKEGAGALESVRIGGLLSPGVISGVGAAGAPGVAQTLGVIGSAMVSMKQEPQCDEDMLPGQDFAFDKELQDLLNELAQGLDDNGIDFDSMLGAGGGGVPPPHSSATTEAQALPLPQGPSSTPGDATVGAATRCSPVTKREMSPVFDPHLASPLRSPSSGPVQARTSHGQGFPGSGPDRSSPARQTMTVLQQQQPQQQPQRAVKMPVALATPQAAHWTPMVPHSSVSTFPTAVTTAILPRPQSKGPGFVHFPAVSVAAGVLGSGGRGSEVEGVIATALTLDNTKPLSHFDPALTSNQALLTQSHGIVGYGTKASGTGDGRVFPGAQAELLRSHCVNPKQLQGHSCTVSRAGVYRSLPPASQQEQSIMGVQGSGPAGYLGDQPTLLKQKIEQDRMQWQEKRLQQEQLRRHLTRPPPEYQDGSRPVYLSQYPGARHPLPGLPSATARLISTPAQPQSLIPQPSPDPSLQPPTSGGTMYAAAGVGGRMFRAGNPGRSVLAGGSMYLQHPVNSQSGTMGLGIGQQGMGPSLSSIGGGSAVSYRQSQGPSTVSSGVGRLSGVGQLPLQRLVMGREGGTQGVGNHNVQPQGWAGRVGGSMIGCFPVGGGSSFSGRLPLQQEPSNSSLQQRMAASTNQLATRTVLSNHPLRPVSQAQQQSIAVGQSCGLSQSALSGGVAGGMPTTTPVYHGNGQPQGFVGQDTTFDLGGLDAGAEFMDSLGSSGAPEDWMDLDALLG
uniref:mastermind-like protein 3 isoform X1 n=1 Tax=Myxine glutinosa TaxID=7769 RepID=UPI00358DF720